MKLSRQLSVLVLFTTLGLVILGGLALETIKSNLIESRKHEITTILTYAQQEASHFVQLEKEGKITRKEAEDRVVESLSAMRTGSSYIWSNDNNAIARVHVNQAKIGTKQDSYAGQMQQLQNKEFAFVIQENSKPGQTGLVTKINGITKIPEWNWIIGYGVYLDDLDATFWSAAISFIMAGIAIILVIIGSATFLARSIIKKIGGEPSYAMDVTSQIADGYLNKKIEGQFAKDSLLGSIARMQSSLQDMVKNIHQGSTLLNHSSKQLNSQMEHISTASQKSSDASYSTASAIQELSSCIEEIANSAQNTEANSEESSNKALQGEALVQKSAQSIDAISKQITQSTEEIASLQKRSVEIGNIVKVIRDIAEQTNLLALNAAIEAARAGEQGRGFAVVADEVRTLASRTATATAEITETINIIQEETEKVATTMQAILPQVQLSVSSSNEVSLMLSSIRTGTDETLARIREVTHSSQEQNKATESLAMHIESISHMIEETAQAVSNSKDSMQELDELAIKLHESVSYFKV